MNIHFFDVVIAKEVGVIPAVLYSHIAFWVGKNHADGKHYHDCKYWTYMSIRGFSNYFPYLTERQIETALRKLKKANLIVTGNYNKAGYDRTTWYSVTNKAISISQNGEIHSTETGESISQKCEIETTNLWNRNHENVPPIPDIEPNIKPDNNIGRDTSPKKFQKPTLEELKRYIDEKNLNVDAEKFLDYYSSNGWRVGKNPMKSWEATVRNWNRREEQEKKTEPDSRFNFDRSVYQ